MPFLSCFKGGLVGAVIGVLIWVLIGYFAHSEVGVIAWFVGILVGIGARYAAHLDDQDESFAQGIYAALMAAGAILLAKYILYMVAFQQGGDLLYGDLFSLWDIVWMGIATITAFRIASGNIQSED